MRYQETQVARKALQSDQGLVEESLPLWDRRQGRGWAEKLLPIKVAFAQRLLQGNQHVSV